jgi:hypothetical protein
MAMSDETLSNVLVHGLVKDIHEAWHRKSLRATVILVYCGMDALAYLTLPAERPKATRADFVAWSDKYIRFRDANGESVLMVPGLEAYAARCALVHTYGTEASLHTVGTVKRQLGYVDETLPEVQEHAEVANLAVSSIRGLVDAFSRGVVATLQVLKEDPNQRAVFAVRLEKMVREVPFGK